MSIPIPLPLAWVPDLSMICLSKSPALPAMWARAVMNTTTAWAMSVSSLLSASHKLTRCSSFQRLGGPNLGRIQIKNSVSARERCPRPVLLDPPSETRSERFNQIIVLIRRHDGEELHHVFWLDP